MRTSRRPVAGLVATVLLAAGAAGCGLLDRDDGLPGEDGDLGVVDYRQTRPEMLTREHVSGPVEYELRPPVGGDHNGAWQSCVGAVYDAPIADEHAVHSLEHGAVWVTYHPDLAADQVAALAERVEGVDKLFMSPYPDLDVPISLQAWGYQLKVGRADDPLIDEFIRTFRVTASLEGPTARCDSGVTSTGPLDSGG
jgi:hypothetical protein